ncbi:MAG TPA: DUF6776 family protein [Usitatibacteraceae bacterium]|nr:DUF6776 family protein [Usitatibacteraceae bacterium]
MLSELKLRGAWRKIRARIGIRAERMAITSHSPWYVRFASYGLMMGVAGAVAWYLVDNQYRITGFNREEAKAQIATLTAENEKLRRDYQQTKSLLNERDGELKVEKSTLADFTRNLAQLQEENNSLKEDLGFLRNIMSTGSVPEGVAISNLKIEPDAMPGEYRYRLLVTQGGRRKQDLKAKIQLVARFQQGTQLTNLAIPTDAELRTGGTVLEFRFYQRAEGRFRIPDGVQLKSVQVRLFGVPGNELLAQKSQNL